MNTCGEPAVNTACRLGFYPTINFKCKFVQKECKRSDIFVTKIGQTGHLYSNKFRPLKIGKREVASGFRPRNDINPFRANVLKEGTLPCGSHPFKIKTQLMLSQ